MIHVALAINTIWIYMDITTLSVGSEDWNSILKLGEAVWISARVYEFGGNLHSRLNDSWLGLGLFEFYHVNGINWLSILIFYWM